MSQRQRKLAGILACVLFLIVYCLAAMALGAWVAVGAPGPFEAVYFILAGIAWLPVVMGIVRWMARPDT